MEGRFNEEFGKRCDFLKKSPKETLEMETSVYKLKPNLQKLFKNTRI